MDICPEAPEFLVKPLLPTAAANVALPAFAAVRAPCCGGAVAAGRPLSIHISCSPGTQQQTSSSGVRRKNGAVCRTGRRTDPVPLHRPMLHIPQQQNH